MRTVRFTLTQVPPGFEAAREFYERTERVAEYLSRVKPGDNETVVRDFPWSAEEVAVVPLLAQRFGFDHFCFCVGDGSEIPALSPMDKLMLFVDNATPPWFRLGEDIEVVRAEGLRIFDLSEVPHVPAHLFPRNHPRHDSCIPDALPDRDSLRCVSSREARGVIQRLGDATPRFPGESSDRNEEGNEEIYVQSIDPAGSRGLLCFEDSHRSGEAYLVYFSDQKTFRNCDVFRYGLAPKTPRLKGSVFEVLLTGRLTILDVLLLNDADQRTLPNVAARLVSAHGAIEALMEVWGHFVSLSSVLLRKRSNLVNGSSATVLPTRYLCSQARSHPYRAGPDPRLLILVAG